MRATSSHSKSRACIARYVYKSVYDPLGDGLGSEADGEPVGVDGWSMVVAPLPGDVGGEGECGEGVAARLEPDLEVVG